MVLKQSASIFFSDDVIPGRYGPLQSALRKFLFFAKFQNLTTSFWLLFSLFYRSANVPFYLFPRKSVNHVRNQPKQPTLLFIVCRRGLGLGQVFPNFLRPCTPSAFRYMSIHLKFLVTKRLGKTTKIYLPISIH